MLALLAPYLVEPGTSLQPQGMEDLVQLASSGGLALHTPPHSRAWVLQTQASRCPPMLLCSPSCASYTFSRATCLLALPHTGPTYSSSLTAHWVAPSLLALHTCPQLVCPYPATFHSALLPTGLGCLCLQIPSPAQAIRLREPLSP